MSAPTLVPAPAVRAPAATAPAVRPAKPAASLKKFIDSHPVLISAIALAFSAAVRGDGPSRASPRAASVLRPEREHPVYFANGMRV